MKRRNLIMIGGLLLFNTTVGAKDDLSSKHFYNSTLANSYKALKHTDISVTDRVDLDQVYSEIGEQISSCLTNTNILSASLMSVTCNDQLDFELKEYVSTHQVNALILENMLMYKLEITDHLGTRQDLQRAVHLQTAERSELTNDKQQLSQSQLVLSSNN